MTRASGRTLAATHATGSGRSDEEPSFFHCFHHGIEFVGVFLLLPVTAVSRGLISQVDGREDEGKGPVGWGGQLVEFLIRMVPFLSDS